MSDEALVGWKKRAGRMFEKKTVKDSGSRLTIVFCSSVRRRLCQQLVVNQPPSIQHEVVTKGEGRKESRSGKVLYDIDRRLSLSCKM